MSDEKKENPTVEEPKDAAANETVEEIKEGTPETAEKPNEKAKEDAPAAVSPELAAEKDKYLRLCAEYDNFRKRTQKEKESIYGDVKAETLKQFLPVFDNLERALAASTADEAYRRGVEMIMTQFNTTMEKLGVKEIEALGKSFDPAFHNAVMHVEDEEKGENEIVEVFQKGFIMGEKVIRFAMVKVAN